jgi:ubiquinone biosynthesis O-methyltransferase
MHQEHIVRYGFAAQLVAGKTVLDVGCGVGYGSQNLAQAGAKSVEAFDLSEEAIRHAKAHYAHDNVQFSVRDAEHFEFDRQFDIVTCFELIEHVNQPERVIANIKRSLSTDGILVMSTPRALEQKRTHFHTREFSYDEFKKLLEKELGVTKIYVENNHFSSLITSGRPSVIDRIICLKNQFTPKMADVFIAVATASSDTTLPTMHPALSVDNDAYVTMLERDVEILHKAENDLRAELDSTRKAEADRAAFQNNEIRRLTEEYDLLFVANADHEQQAWDAARQREADAAIKQAELLAKDDQIAQLRRDCDELLRKTERDSALHWETRETLENLRHAEAERAAFMEEEVVRLTNEYNSLFAARETLENLRYAEAERAAFMEGEVVRLTNEYNTLFAACETAEQQVWLATRSLEDETNQSREKVQFKDDEIERMTREYNLLFSANAALDQQLWDTRQSLEAEVVRAQAEILSKDDQVERLKHDYNELWHKTERDAALQWEARETIERSRHAEAERAAFVEGEVVRLTNEYNTLFAARNTLEQQVWVATRLLEEETHQSQEKIRFKDDEIERLTQIYNEVYIMAERNAALLWEANVKVAEMEQDAMTLQAELSALSTRATDADGRRAEAYDFARVSSERAHGLQRELDRLKRDIAEALEAPKAACHPTYDHRHRDIVESMQRVFLGTEATREIGRDPLVERVINSALDLADKRAKAAQFEGDLRGREDEIAGLRMDLERHRAQLHDAHLELDNTRMRLQETEAELQEVRGLAETRVQETEAELREARERADAYFQLAEVREQQVQRLRNSVSWRITAWIRKLP